MTKRLIDIDDDLLDEARSVLGADTMKSAVNRALAQVVETERRRAHLVRLTTMRGLDLDDAEIMAEAWR